MYELTERSPIEGLEPGQVVELFLSPTDPEDQCRVSVQAPARLNDPIPVQLTYDSVNRGHAIRFNIPPDTVKGSLLCVNWLVEIEH